MGGKHPKYGNGRISLTLLDPDSGLNVAQEMLLSGYAMLPKMKKVRDQDGRDAVKELQEFEEEAWEARRGIFQYGDPGDSDDEAPSQVKTGAWGVKR